MAKTEDVTTRDERAADIKAFLAAIDATSKKSPSEKDLQRLRSLLDNRPEFWSTVADLTDAVEQRMIESTGGKPAFKESLRVGLKQLRKELGYGEAPLLEQMLIRDIVLCWIHYHTTLWMLVGVQMKNHAFAHGNYWQRQVTAAHRQYLRSIEALARVRKLAKRDVLQVNIGGQQINVAG